MVWVYLGLGGRQEAAGPGVGSRQRGFLAGSLQNVTDLRTMGEG